MTLRQGRVPLLVMLALFILASNALAQSADRDELLRQIESMRTQLKQMEPLLLAPAAADAAHYADFLKQPDTGLCRLLPREVFDGLLPTRGGGSYYSFTKRSNSYNSTPQIGLEQGHLRVGFAGADYGYLASLGDLPLDQVTLDHEAAQFLVAQKTPTAEPAAREAYRRVSAGLEGSGYVYKTYMPALVNSTYLVRAISYGEVDTLVAFKVVRQDPDGSLILLWKALKTFPIPQLLRAQPAESQ